MTQLNDKTNPYMPRMVYDWIEAALKYGEANAPTPTTTVSIQVGDPDQLTENYIVFCRKSTWEMMQSGRTTIGKCG